MIYKFKDGRNFGGCSPQRVGDALESLRVRQDGRLRTVDVVKAAAKPESPLHPAFTWDDKIAAERCRLMEAQELIRHVVVYDEQSKVERKAFYTITVSPNEDEGGPDRYYQSVQVLAHSPDEYDRALRQALGNLRGAESSLNALKELAPKDRKTAVHKAGVHVMEAHRILSVDNQVATV